MAVFVFGAKPLLLGQCYFCCVCLAFLSPGVPEIAFGLGDTLENQKCGLEKIYRPLGSGD